MSFFIAPEDDAKRAYEHCGPKLVKTFWLDLTIELATDALGNPIPVPGVTPVKYIKIPVWKIRS